jgi:hypothetical protein
MRSILTFLSLIASSVLAAEFYDCDQFKTFASETRPLELIKEAVGKDEKFSST